MKKNGKPSRRLCVCIVWVRVQDAIVIIEYIFFILKNSQRINVCTLSFWSSERRSDLCPVRLFSYLVWETNEPTRKKKKMKKLLSRLDQMAHDFYMYISTVERMKIAKIKIILSFYLGNRKKYHSNCNRPSPIQKWPK